MKAWLGAALVALLWVSTAAFALRLLPAGYELSRDRTVFVEIASATDPDGDVVVHALDRRGRVWRYRPHLEAWELLSSDRIERVGVAP